MTPEQRRLSHPLNPNQTASDELRNAVNVCLLCWPLSILHAASVEYFRTLSERLAPVHLHTAYPHG
jgi:hypothetical protein